MYFLQGVQYRLLQSRCKGHFDQNNIMCLLFLKVLPISYSSIILNSFSHLLFSKLYASIIYQALVVGQPAQNQEEMYTD